MQTLFNQVRNIVVTAAQDELNHRFAAVTRKHKKDGSLITEADIAMQTRIQNALHELDPNIAFLGEEMSESEQADVMSGDRPFWCLDPLDGTSNFANGIPYFSVSLALIKQHEVVYGLVYDTTRDECFTAATGQPARLNETVLELKPTGLKLKDCTAVVDLKRLDAKLATQLAVNSPFGSQRSFGSVALDWCWMAAGRGQLYCHGKQRIWDYAAGHFIFQRAGGFSSTLSGDSLYDFSLQPRSAVAAVDKTLLDDWYGWISAC